jgi:hypothetical protein
MLAFAAREVDAQKKAISRTAVITDLLRSALQARGSLMSCTAATAERDHRAVG